MRNLYKLCPLCRGSEFKFLRSGSCANNPLRSEEMPAEIRWMQCGSCLHVFTDGFWNAAASEHMFAATKDIHEVGSDLDRTFSMAARVVEKIAQHRGDTMHSISPRWIDVGFGNGALLLAAREYGYEAVGLDIREGNVVAMKRYGVEAYCADITDEVAILNESAAVVSMTEVIEHIPFPSYSLRNIAKMLRPAGLLVLSTPNMSGTLWQHWDKVGTNPFWDEMEHYHNFSRERLYQLLMECGFYVRRYGISERYHGCMEIVASKI